MKPKYTAYLLFFIAVVLVVPVVIKTLFWSEPDLGLIKKYNAQKNPFSVCNDSANVVWSRASEFLESRKRLLSGGDLEQNDSVIYMPYYNDFHKGVSLKIERKKVADSTVFTITVWNSGKPVPLGAKEIALFMATKFDRYKDKK
jgi:hypothetical protein